MSTQANRRDRRYPYPLPVKLTWRRRVEHTTARDVSFNGMFLPTSLQIALRQLVRLDLELPWDELLVSMHAMVVHVAHSASAEDHEHGIGVQFFGLGKSEKEAWLRFVERVRQGVAELDSEGWTVRLRRPQPKPERRQFGRFAALFEVRATHLGELVTMYTRDVSKGGMFLKTEVALGVGDLLHLTIHHPDTDESFSLRGLVRRQVSEPEMLGVGVEFLGMTDAKREEFWRFVSDHLDEIGEDDLLPLSIDVDVSQDDQGDWTEGTEVSLDVED